MKSRLKILCKYLIENRNHEAKGWHDAYHEFYGQVRQIRERIKEGEDLPQNDQIFLRQLLYDKSDMVTSRGQPVLSNDNLLSFIKIQDFISTLAQFILTPNKLNAAVDYSSI